jgi:two-component system response regulator HydG
MARRRKPISEMDLAVLKVEYDLIVDALKKVDFDKAKAARLLCVDRKTIRNKLKMYRKYFMVEDNLPA